MLRYHIDPMDGIVRSSIQFLLEFRKSNPIWPPLEILVHSSNCNPFRTLASHSRRTILRLARLLDGRIRVGEIPRWEPTFETFLLDSFSVLRPPVQLSPRELKRLCAMASIKIMVQELRFNMCTFPSSFTRNDEVGDRKMLVEAHTSSHLRYACCHWGSHISELETIDADLLDILFEFFQTRFLSWLEIMSLLDLSPAKMFKVFNIEKVRDLIVLAIAFIY